MRWAGQASERANDEVQQATVPIRHWDARDPGAGNSLGPSPCTPSQQWGKSQPILMAYMGGSSAAANVQQSSSGWDAVSAKAAEGAGTVSIGSINATLGSGIIVNGHGVGCSTQGAPHNPIIESLVCPSNFF